VFCRTEANDFAGPDMCEREENAINAWFQANHNKVLQYPDSNILARLSLSSEPNIHDEANLCHVVRKPVVTSGPYRVCIHVCFSQLRIASQTSCGEDLTVSIGITRKFRGASIHTKER